MSEHESIRDIVLHQKKHNIVKNVILNEREQETISVLPKESDDLVEHWAQFHWEYRYVSLMLSGMCFAVAMMSAVVVGMLKEKTQKNEMKKENALTLLCVVGGVGLIGTVGGLINLREAAASQIIYKNYYKEYLKRQVQREKE